MSFRDDILPDVDSIRGIPGELGLRRFAVSVLVRTHSGARPGISGGTWTDVTTPLKVAGGTQNPKVTQVTSKDVVASGGLYQVGDFRIGPLTTEWAGGGTPFATLSPATTSTAREVFFVITGPGLPTGGVTCQRVSDETMKNFHVNVIVRAMATP